MTRLDRRSVVFGACLSAHAGFVDAIGFLDLGGFFVSFMSGNTTRLGIGIGTLNTEVIILAAGLITLFVAGVFAGSLVGRRVAEEKRRSVILAGVAMLLGAGSLLHSALHIRLGTACLAMAMGLENTVLRRDGVAVGLTYMTGNLVRIGHAIADAFHGGSHKEWLRYFIIFLGLIAGATFGAMAHSAYAMASLWFGVVYAALMAIWTLTQKPSSKPEPL